MISLRRRIAGPRSRRMLLPALLFLLFASMSALGVGARAAEETRRVEGLFFDEIEVRGDMEVEISQDDSMELQLRGAQEDLNESPFYLKGSTLVLGKANKYFARESKGIKARVTLPTLTELKVDGSGNVYVTAFVLSESERGEAPRISADGSGDVKLFSLTGPALELRVKGSGMIKAVDVFVDDLEALVGGSGDLFMQNVKAQTGELVITGSGDLTVTDSGFISDLEVSVVGSGDARLSPLDCDRAEVNIVGSGDASIGTVNNTLNASILGSGDIRYGGKPEVEKALLGSGEVRRRD
jgi:hypothetical protein